MADRWGDDNPFGRATSRGESDLDFTPLIDVVFLLLVFFMYSAAMNRQAEVDMPAARRGTGVDPAYATMVTILAADSPDDEDRVVLGDAGDGEEERRASLDDVRRLVEEGVRSGKFDVIVKAERTVRHQSVLEVARIVNEVDGAKLAVAVREAPP
jgi:biopolymer transport protein ExbD